MALAAPQPLTDHHALVGFSSGVAVLDDWLRRRALANQASGASRTYVVTEGAVVCGYYALASGAVASSPATGRFRRNMPDPVPVAILGRLAIDRAFQQRGLGRALFADAARRVLQAAETIGIRGLLVHAISDDARDFYVALGLEPSSLDPLTLMATLADMRSILG